MSRCLLLMLVSLSWSAGTVRAVDFGEESVCFSEQNVKFLRTASNLDCYFTIEEVDREFPRRSPQYKVYSQWLASLQEHDTLEAFLKDLNKNLKGAIAYRKNKHSRIIHIMDSSLVSQKKYVLNSTVSLNFWGSPTEMLDELEKSVGRVSRAKIGTVGLGRIDADINTQITVNARNEELRSILSNYLPLSSYNRLLWIAETKPDFSETWIRFKGKAAKFIYLNELQREEMIDFSTGEMAYYANRERPGANLAARQFIQQRMKEKNPSQVRWAMLFLGIQRDEEAIRLLLKHIDYLYMPTGLIEESYPAVKVAVQFAGEARVLAAVGSAAKKFETGAAARAFVS